jgi:exodeoxyribonuclease-3
VESSFNVDALAKEGRVLRADYSRFALLNVYFPNGRSSAERLKYKMDFYDAFLEFADKIVQEGQNVVICGDVNTAHKEIDLARPKANENTSGFLQEERAWIDQLLNHGYVDTLRMFNQEPEQYTYWDQMSRARERNVGWRIDYFFVNQGFAGNVKAAFILSDVMGSDHCPVGIEIE